jgi:hypothetical protein
MSTRSAISLSDSQPSLWASSASSYTRARLYLRTFIVPLLVRSCSFSRSTFDSLTRYFLGILTSLLFWR